MRGDTILGEMAVASMAASTGLCAEAKQGQEHDPYTRTGYEQ